MDSNENKNNEEQLKEFTGLNSKTCWHCKAQLFNEDWCDQCKAPIKDQYREEILNRTNVSEYIKCWRCLGTTSGDICGICGSPLTKIGLELISQAKKHPSYSKEKDGEEAEKIVIFSPKDKQFVRVGILYSDLITTIRKNLKIMNSIITNYGPEIIVEVPKDNVNYDNLEIEELLVKNNVRMLIKKTKSTVSSEELALIQFFYWEPEDANKRLALNKIQWKLILLALSLTTIMITGWFYYREIFRLFSISKNVFIDAILYTFTLITILGIHELGHLIMQYKKKITLTLPYFIPLPPSPGLLSFFMLGTAGGFVRVTDPVRKRNDLFDLYFIGPICGLGLSIVFYLVGSAFPYIEEKALLTPEIQEEVILITKFDPYLIMGKFLEWFTKNIKITPSFNPETQFLFPHPITNAALVGIIINGLNFLPGGILDGGFMFRSLFNERVTKLFSFISALLVMINYNTWLLGILIMFMPITRYKTPVTNEALPAHWSKYLLELFAIIIAFCCLPLPISIFFL
ncbi:MAG: site-2 protease family protein [Candidatus Heimdallarchaeota archaeon]|nr:site-2 protease family protein [Candidatus Heimdallarchaeota archaeon]